MPPAEADGFGWHTILIWLAISRSKNFGPTPQAMGRCGHVFKERRALQGSSNTGHRACLRLWEAIDESAVLHNAFCQGTYADGSRARIPRASSIGTSESH